MISDSERSLMMSPTKKVPYYGSKNAVIVHEGSKTMWRQRTTLDIFIALHKAFHIMEVICFNPTLGMEADRIYASLDKFKNKLSQDDIDEKLRVRMEIYIRQKKIVPREEVLLEELEHQLVQYIVARLNLKDSSDETAFEVTLSNPLSKVDDILCEKPQSLEPIIINLSKKISVEEFQSKLTQFREESIAVKKHNDHAMHALHSDAYYISNEVVTSLHDFFEKKQHLSKPTMRWLAAINKIIFLNQLAKVKLQLAAIEEARIKKQGENKIVRKKTQRRTLDNSQLDSPGALQRTQSILPPVAVHHAEGQTLNNANTASKGPNLSVLPPVISPKHLPAVEQKVSVQQTNRERRRKRNGPVQQRRSFDNEPSASLQDSEGGHSLTHAVRGPHSSHSQLAPLSIDEIMLAANRPAPSLLNSYRDKSLESMYSIHSLSISQHDIMAANAASAAESLAQQPPLRELERRLSDRISPFHRTAKV